MSEQRDDMGVDAVDFVTDYSKNIVLYRLLTDNEQEDPKYFLETADFKEFTAYDADEKEIVDQEMKEKLVARLRQMGYCKPTGDFNNIVECLKANGYPVKELLDHDMFVVSQWLNDELPEEHKKAGGEALIAVVREYYK
jgi:hypothetical protein